MGLYAVDKIITEARRIAVEYRQATGKTLPLTAEIAVNDAVRILSLQQNNKLDASYDAVMNYGDEQLKVQIKGRAIFDEHKSGYRLGQLKLEQDWDAVLLVLMDKQFESQEIYLARRDELTEYLNSRASKRASISVARFKIIGDLVWTTFNQMDNGYWSNDS